MSLSNSISWLRAKVALITLGAIITLSVILSIYWVFAVPIYQAPDEPLHLDYALNIYSAGRPISARESLRDWNAAPGDYHVFTQYLIRESSFYSMGFNTSV